ncbi:MAG: class I SAM-dependent methyltransferase, partial [bacterium]
IFFGIPVLISNLSEYLRDNFYIILELSKRYGQVNRNLVADSLLLAKKAKPKDKKELFEQTKKQYAERVKALFENNYIISHYDNFSALAKPDEPLYDFLNEYQDKTPHLVLEEFLKSYWNSKDSLALEIGCNVGGFLITLSQHARFLFGLDNSFEHLFFTSCLLKRLPVKINQYKVVVEADIKKRRHLNVKTVDNLTLIAGRGDNLPFRDFSLSIISSCNLIDVIDNPAGLLGEKIRILKKKGLLLSSDPYQFLGENKKKLKVKKGQTPWQRIQEILTPRIKILEERDYIPWITRGYQRHYTIYYNHSFCGRKR